MPLTRAGDPPEAEALCVGFWMWNSEEQPVRCCVTSEALRYAAQIIFGFTDKAANEQLFTTHRHQIEQAASLKYDQGNIDNDGVLITSNDIALISPTISPDVNTSQSDNLDPESASPHTPSPNTPEPSHDQLRSETSVLEPTANAPSPATFNPFVPTSDMFIQSLDKEPEPTSGGVAPEPKNRKASDFLARFLRLGER